MKRAARLLLALLPAMLVFLMIYFKPFYTLDAMLCDWLYAQMNGVGDTIKLICIDEKTLAEYGTFTTWSREKSAELIDVLYADSNKSPKVLAFDLIFTGQGDEKADERLTEAAKKVPNLVLATNLLYRGNTVYGESFGPYYEIQNIAGEELPYEALGKTARSGFANAELSKDGFVRTTSVKKNVNGQTRYSFSGEIVRTYLGATGENLDCDTLEKEERVQFFYSGKPGEFIHYSMKDVLDGSVRAEEFQDCIVLVGVYAPGMQDAYHNAAKRGQDMYGVEINANIVRALMLDKTAVVVNPLWVALVVASIIFLYVYLARIMNLYPALLMGLWVLLLSGIIGRVLAVRGFLISQVYTLLIILLIWAWIIIEKYVFEAVRRRQTLSTFRKYMAPQVIDSLTKDDLFEIKLGGEKRQVAILFVDIRGFTQMSEALNPEQVVQILNRYLSLVTECVFEYGGMLDKFIGDAAMAIFNAPNDQKEYVKKAIQSGLMMQEKGKALGQKLLEQYGKQVDFGVGIHTGEAVVGNIGCEIRMDYTAIGDTVNTASRIEGCSKKGEVLVSEVVYSLVKDDFEMEEKDFVSLKGKAEKVKIYRVIAEKEKRGDGEE